MEISPVYIGRRIREKRISKNLSQYKLADISGISYGYLSRIECGKKPPSLVVLIRIAHALDTSVDSLLLSNQIGRTYEKELAEIMKDCTLFEKQVIIEVIGFMKKSIRENAARYL